MRFIFYWFSRWPWLTALVCFFVYAALLPAFTWYARTPMLIAGVGITFVVLLVVRGSIAQSAVLEQIVRDADQDGQ